MAQGTENNAVEALVEEGLELYSQGRLQDAIARWHEALAQQPEHPRALDYIRYVQDNRSALEASFQLASASSESLHVVGGGVMGGGEPAGRQEAEDGTDGGASGGSAAAEAAEDSGPRPERAADPGAGTELELEAEPDDAWSAPEPERGGAAAMAEGGVSITAEQQRVLEEDPRKTLPLPGIVESTARMNVEELQSKVDLTKKGSRPTPAMHSPMVDAELERSRRPTPLMVVPGDGAPDDGGFEPMENTPVGVGLPQPARLVPSPDDGSFDELQRTPVVVPPADLFEEEPHPPTPARPAGDGDERVASMLSGARQLHDQGTYEGSLWLCERVLAMDSDNADARALLEKNRAILLSQSKDQIGDLAAVPVIQIPQHEIMWHKLDHRAGFLLSRIDGQLSFEEVIDVSGMGEFEASRILSQLMALGVIGPRR